MPRHFIYTLYSPGNSRFRMPPRHEGTKSHENLVRISCFCVLAAEFLALVHPKRELLYSPSADKFCIGQTPGMETRLLFHKEVSDNSFTPRYRPWVLKRIIAVIQQRQR